MAASVSPASFEDELVEGDAAFEAHLQDDLHQRAIVV